MTAAVAVGALAAVAAAVIFVALACREAGRTIDAVLNGPLDPRDVDLWSAQIMAAGPDQIMQELDR